MNDIRILMVSSVNDGKIDRVKAILREHADECKLNRGYLLGYEFFFSEDESEMYALEWFKDSASVMKHVADTSETLAQLNEVTQTKRVEVFGDPSPELAETFDAFGAISLRPWYGFRR